MATLLVLHLADKIILVELKIQPESTHLQFIQLQPAQDLRMEHQALPPHQPSIMDLLVKQLLLLEVLHHLFVQPVLFLALHGVSSSSQPEFSVDLQYCCEMSICCIEVPVIIRHC